MADTMTEFQPVGPNSYYWDTSATVYAGMPVVAKGSGNPGMVTIPAGASTDIIIGVALEDAGPNAAGDGTSKTTIAVAEYGVVKMYAYGTIHEGSFVKIYATGALSITPPGYASTQSVWVVQAATQTAAGSAPYPVVGIALTETTANGQVLYVKLLPIYY